MEKIKNLFDFEGKLNREKYLIYMLSISFGAGILITVFITIAPVMGVLVTMLCVIVALSAHIRRLHDIGKSGWLVLLFFVPLVNAIFILYLFFKPGLASIRINEKKQVSISPEELKEQEQFFAEQRRLRLERLEKEKWPNIIITLIIGAILILAVLFI